MSQPDQPTPQAPAPFNPNAPHQQKPKVRALRGFPVEAQDPQGNKHQMLGLADARQISDKMCIVAPATQIVLPMMDGSRTIDEIVAQVGRGLNRQIMEGIVAQLDDAALIEGPRFQELLAKSRQEFDQSDVLPPASTAAFADMLVMQAIGKDATEQQKAEQGPKKLREMFDRWIGEVLKNVEHPSFNELPKAIVAPHLDYPRGWMNYASIYGRLRICDKPDRVIILGTNHFGTGTGVVVCNKGYQTPLGTCDVDKALLDALTSKLGSKATEHRFDHEREHSIELHIPWIQHVFGSPSGDNFPKVLGILVHDPTVNNGASYDGNGVSTDEFVAALKFAIGMQSGKTLIVSSADLSHVGPAFGDQKTLVGETPEAEAERNRVVQHDLQMLDFITKNDVPGLIGSMSWQQNPTRWCSIGNLCATLQVVAPEKVELLNYAAAIDPQGSAMVSSAAVVMR